MIQSYEKIALFQLDLFIIHRSLDAVLNKYFLVFISQLSLTNPM